MRFCLMRLVGICLLLTVVSVAHSKSWKGIVPLRSNRGDVEKLLGPSAMKGRGEYDTQDQHVSVAYSRGPCVLGWPYGWEVPADTVTSIRIAPKAPLSLDSLGIDVTKYKKENESDMPSHIIYVNQQEGISIEFNEAEGKVQAVNYFPADRERRLLCPGAATLMRNVEKTRQYHIGSYSPSDGEDEKSSLDHMKKELLKLNPKWKGYVLSYAGSKAKRNEARIVAARARNYLVKNKSISAKRIYAMDGGHRDAAQVELFVIPPDGLAPAPFPTIDPRDVRIVDKNGPKKRRGDGHRQQSF